MCYCTTVGAFEGAQAVHDDAHQSCICIIDTLRIVQLGFKLRSSMTLWAHGGIFLKLCKDRFRLGQPFTCAYRAFTEVQTLALSAIIDWGQIEVLSKMYTGFVLTSSVCVVYKPDLFVPLRLKLCLSVRECVHVVGVFAKLWVRCPSCVYFVPFYEYMGSKLGCRRLLCV